MHSPEDVDPDYLAKLKFYPEQVLTNEDRVMVEDFNEADGEDQTS